MSSIEDLIETQMSQDEIRAILSKLAKDNMYAYVLVQRDLEGIYKQNRLVLVDDLKNLIYETEPEYHQVIFNLYSRAKRYAEVVK